LLNPKQLLTYFLLAVSGLLAWCFYNADVQNTNRQMLGAVLIAISCVPFAAFLNSKGTNQFPLFAFNTLYYAVGFGFGGFFMGTPLYESGVSDADIFLAQSITIIGVLCQIIGFRLFRFKARSVTLRVKQLSIQQLKIGGWVSLLVSLLPLVVAEIASVPSLPQLLRLAGMAGVSILFYQILVKQSSSFEIGLFATIAGYIIVGGILSGSIAEGLRYGILFCFISIVTRRFKLTFIIAFVSILLLILINPVKPEFRQQTWHGSSSTQMRYLKKAELLTRLTVDYWSGQSDGAANIHRDRNTTIDRINQFPLLIVVVSDTPTSVPFWMGETYVNLAFALIPRFVWPDKPEIRTGNAFGQRYRLLHRNDWTTSVNLPWIVEFYANFGLFGIIFGMMGCGIAFKIIENGPLSCTDRTGSSVLYIGLFGPLSYPESNLAIMWGGVILGWLCLNFATNIARKGFPDKR